MDCSWQGQAARLVPAIYKYRGICTLGILCHSPNRDDKERSLARDSYTCRMKCSLTLFAADGAIAPKKPARLASNRFGKTMVQNNLRPAAELRRYPFHEGVTSKMFATYTGLSSR